MKELGNKLVRCQAELDEYLKSLEKSPGNEKLLWLTYRAANTCFRVAAKIYDSPHVLPDLLEACKFLQGIHCLFARIEDAAGEVSPVRQATADDTSLFHKNLVSLNEESDVIRFRIANLRELLDGELIGEAPMSHEEMLNFIDTLAPCPGEHGLLGKADVTQTHLEEFAGTPKLEKHPDPEGVSIRFNDKSKPAGPLSQNQLSEAINPSRLRANADEPQPAPKETSPLDVESASPSPEWHDPSKRGADNREFHNEVQQVVPDAELQKHLDEESGKPPEKVDTFQGEEIPWEPDDEPDFQEISDRTHREMEAESDD